MDEKAVIAECQRGNIDAYGELVRRYQSQLIALAWNMVGSGEDARDIAQESLIAAFNHLRSFDPQREFKSWLFTITARKCLDWLRRKRSFLKFFRTQTRDREEFLAKAIDHTPVEESLLLGPLLQKISHRERTAIILRVNEGYSAREIAEVLNCTESTVRAHLLNAKRKLKRELVNLNGADGCRLLHEEKT